MRRAGLDAHEGILLSKPSNIFYASGYTGEGVAVIAHGLCAIITDFRYTEQAQRQAPTFTVHEIKTAQPHAAVAYELLRAAGVTALKIEEDCVTLCQMRGMKKAMPEMTFSSLDGAVEAVREIKDEREIALVQKACAISDEAFSYILREIKEGMSEMDIRIALEFKMLSLGASGLAFDTIVASGENGSLCHAIPGQRKIKNGDMITIDFGAKWQGYCADMTRTVALGEPSEKMREIYGVVLRAQEEAQGALRAGMTGAQVDKVARDIIDGAGYQGCFGHGLGHSLGIDIHESPRLSSVCHTVLEENVLMTVEPGIYKPGLGGVRIENTTLITSGGAKPLTHSPKELLVL